MNLRPQGYEPCELPDCSTPAAHINTVEAFEPDDETLLPESELEDLAEVTVSDVDKAIAAWQANPPDNQFANLLEAVSDG